METNNTSPITVETTVNASIDKVWDYWTKQEHIKKWNSASDDWHTPKAENDLRVGGVFSSRMEAKDGSFGFDFGGEYTRVEKNKHIDYTLGDGRKVKIIFSSEGNKTIVTETFDPESENTIELQKGGWQAIMESFKKYTENN